MSNTDLTLIHPPTVYDFRENPRIWSPISDLAISTPMFEMYPLGFASMACYLGREGYNVKIDNIALKMLLDKNFDVEYYFKKMKTKAIGIDLHWLPHAHGSLKLAQIFKKYHPETPVIFGGLSASYYYEELIKKKEVDFILRGDSCELPLLRLMENLERRNFEEVPNLVFKKGEEIKVNPITHVPENLDDFTIDYSYFLKNFRGIQSIIGYVPFMDFLDKPIMAVMSCKGCAKNCPTCGGSSFSYSKLCNRGKTAFNKPEKLVEDILAISAFKSPCIIIGDLLEGGEKYAYKVLDLIKKESVDIPLIFEFFSPPEREFFERISKVVPDYCVEISPDSHDEHVRRFQDKGYDNFSLHKMIESAFENNCSRFDIYYIVGIGLQTRDSVDQTVNYCDLLLKEYSKKGNIFTFLSPYAPFLDPGSLAFEFPEKYGFVKHCQTLAEHLALLDSANTWRELLSYETQYLSRDDIVECTYDSAFKLANIKANYGLLTSEERDKILRRIELSRHVIEVSQTLNTNGGRPQPIPKEIAEELNDRIFCKREEFNWASFTMKQALKLLGFKI